ncbi:hypothetical protein, partial [Ralstonia pseudosolanacearum]|uniref:hypothetical protein n=1 Tax=Ralstonia pseudosolanacearum TaxID=1310165 RepID=UPI003CF7C323
MDLAIDDLKHAFGESSNFDIINIDKFVSELKVWLGGALTFQETCLEGFDNTTSKAGDDMRKALKTSMELTRNGLAIIDQIASVITSYNIPLLQRRLLSSEEEFRNVSENGFPTWVSPEKRRLLATRRRRIRANIVVAKDGSGKYRTINEALNDIPKRNVKPF